MRRDGQPASDRKQETSKQQLIGGRSIDWWTGRPPIIDRCPGVGSNGKIRSLPQLDLARARRADFLDYYDNTWTMTEVLFSALQGEAAFNRRPSHGLRHPLIFYYCHPAVFYVNKLRLAGILTEAVDEDFEQLFATGVDEMSWDDLSRSEMEWPAVEEITEYRRKVYQLVGQAIERHPALAESERPFLESSPAWALAMAFEHERIHLETSSVLMREMPLSFLLKPREWPDEFPAGDGQASAAPENPLVFVPACEVTIGKSREQASFGWDNEYGSREVSVPSFEAGRFPVSSGEFLQFVKAGGYHEKKYWSDAGWSWRSFRNTKWPQFWVLDGPAGLHRYRLRTTFAVQDFDPRLPAVVNFHEAKAFCAWKSDREHITPPYRLLTEAEHHSLRHAAGVSSAANIGLVSGSERPVGEGVSPSSLFGDVSGNVWQWCEDEFNPLPGFQVHRFYDDFSTPCFDGEHQMIMGGSFVSTGDEAGSFARFHFRPHFFQHVGFRLARSLGGAALPAHAVKLSVSLKTSPAYETSDLLSQYMLLHYAEPKDVFPYEFAPQGALGFPKRAANVVISEARSRTLPMRTALDVGCAVGGASFELARAFDSVIGVDLSAAFIAAAETVKSRGEIEYVRKDEGDIATPLVARVDAEINRAKVQFRRADACSLPPEYMGFDAVLLANLLCRLPSPRSLLSRMAGPRGLVARGGLLVTISPYSWLEEFTPKGAWIGGTFEGGRQQRSRQVLHEILDRDFECLREDEMPLVIREHARKYQYIVSHLMVWQRR